MSDIEIIYLITRWQGYVLTACCILCFIGFGRLNQAAKQFSYYLFFLLLSNSIMLLLAYAKENNLVGTHLVVLGEFIFLSFFFKEILKRNTFFQKYFRLYLGIFGGLILANTLFLEEINTFNTNAKTLILFVIIFLATAFFYDRSKQLMEADIHEKALRIINAALLIYYSGSFFVYLFYKFTVNNEVFYSNKIMIFNASLYAIFTLMAFSAMIMMVLRKPEGDAGELSKRYDHKTKLLKP